MSIEKNVHEAARWLKTAETDLDSAIILRKSTKYAHACFHSQQAGEKALKAVWYWSDKDPWGHSIRKLINDLESVDQDTFKRIEDLVKSANFLDRYYIPTRYPNGLPDLTPDDVYMEEDADACITHANKIIVTVKRIIKNIQ